MSENWAIALVIFVLGQAGLVITAGITAFFMLSSRIAEVDKTFEHRITGLETKAEKWFVLTSTSTLHSPDNHLGADSELENFAREYKQHNHDLPPDRWQHYSRIFQNVIDNDRATPNERCLAESLFELCEHKMLGCTRTHTKKLT